MKKNKIFKVFGQKHLKFCTWGNVLAVLSVFFMLILAQITQLFIDSIHTSSGTKNVNFGVLWEWVTQSQTVDLEVVVLVLSISFICVAIFKNACTFGASQCYYTFATKSRSALRRACFKKLAFTDNSPSPKHTFFNLTSDVNDFADVLYRHKPKMFDSLTKIVLAGILCIFIDPQIALGFLIVVPVIFCIGFLISKKLDSLASEARNRKSTMFATSEEFIENIKDIKTFGADKWAIEQYSQNNIAHTKTITASNNLVNHHKICINLLRVLGILLAVILSSYACFMGMLSVGYFVLIMAYAIIIFDACTVFLTSFYEYKACAVSARRLAKFLGRPSSIKEQNAILAPKFDIEFQNVKLSTKEQLVFSGLNLKIKFGTHIALLCGQTSGKTSLARLMLRFLNKTDGQILYGGNPYEIYSINSLRKGFSYIAQEPAIFEGTISDNITMFAKANPKQLQKAIIFAGLENLVNSLPSKEQHFLVESGKNIPAQTRQKIAVARAIYRNAPTLLIDNAFTKFNQTEAKELLENIITCWKGKTIIFLTDNPELASLMNKTVQPFKGGAKK